MDTSELYYLLRPRDLPRPSARATTVLQVQLTLPSHTLFVDVAAALTDCAQRLNGHWSYPSHPAQKETP